MFASKQDGSNYSALRKIIPALFVLAAMLFAMCGAPQGSKAWADEGDQLEVAATAQASADSQQPGLTTQAASDITIVNSLKLAKGKTRYVAIDNVEGDVTWASTKPKVATAQTVNGTGKITAKKAGKTIIYCTIASTGKKFGVNLTVTNKSVSAKKIALNKKNVTIKKGKTVKLKLKNAKASKVTWISNKSKIASVNKKGVVKGVKVGKTKIFALYEGKSYTCKVKVRKAGGTDTPSKPDTPPSNVTIGFIKNGSVSSVAKASSDVAIGSLSNQGYEVDIPAGAFPGDTNVTVTVRDNGKIDVSAAGKSHVRLDEPMTVKVGLTGSVPEKEIDYWRGVYYFDGEEYLIEPDLDQLRNGVLQYDVAFLTQSLGGADMATQAEAAQAPQSVNGLSAQSDEGWLSWFGAKKLTEAEMKAAVAYKDALYNIHADAKNDAIQVIVEDTFGAVADQLGYATDPEARKNLMDKLGKTATTVGLIEAAANGDTNAFTDKASQLIMQCIVEDADGTKLGYLGSAVGSIPTVLEQVRDGKSADAAATVLKAVTSNIPYVKMTQFAASMTETTIDYYVDIETEAAYKAYFGIVKDGGFGYETATASAQSIIEQQMAAPLRQMCDKAIKDYAKTHGMSPDAVSEEMQKKLRTMVVDNLFKQFKYRYDHDIEIAKRQEETLEVFKWFEEEGLLWRGYSPGFGKDDDYQKRLQDLLYVRANILNMLEGKTYSWWSGLGAYALGGEQAEKDYNNEMVAKLVALWVNNGWPGKGHCIDGRHAVAVYIAENLGIGVSLKQGDTYSMKVGDKEKFELTGAFSEPQWSTSNAKIATVTAGGVVKGIKKGTANITAKYGKKKYVCKVTVAKADTVEYSLNEKTSLMSVNFGDTKSIYLNKIVNGDVANKVKVSVPESAWQVELLEGKEPTATYNDGGIDLKIYDPGKVTVKCKYDGQWYSATLTINVRYPWG